MYKKISKIIQKLIVATRIRKYKNIDGWLSLNEATTLYTLSNKNKNGILVEIGSWKGKSTYCLAMGLKNGQIYAIVPFNGIGEPGSKDVYEKLRDEKQGDLYTQFKNNLESRGVWKRTVPIIGKSEDVYDSIPNCNVLFIDGDHSIEGCKRDCNLYFKKIINGGYIMFHDYYANRKDIGPKIVVDSLLKSGKVHFVELADTLWVGQKIK